VTYSNPGEPALDFEPYNNDPANESEQLLFLTVDEEEVKAIADKKILYESLSSS
jgi:hypothetical protein